MDNLDRIDYLFDVLNSGIDFLEDVINEDDTLTIEQKKWLDHARDLIIRSSTCLMKSKYVKKAS